MCVSSNRTQKLEIIPFFIHRDSVSDSTSCLLLYLPPFLIGKRLCIYFLVVGLLIISHLSLGPMSPTVLPFADQHMDVCFLPPLTCSDLVQFFMPILFIFPKWLQLPLQFWLFFHISWPSFFRPRCRAHTYFDSFYSLIRRRMITRSVCLAASSLLSVSSHSNHFRCFVVLHFVFFLLSRVALAMQINFIFKNLVKPTFYSFLRLQNFISLLPTRFFFRYSTYTAYRAFLCLTPTLAIH